MIFRSIYLSILLLFIANNAGFSLTKSKNLSHSFEGLFESDNSVKLLQETVENSLVNQEQKGQNEINQKLVIQQINEVNHIPDKVTTYESQSDTAFMIQLVVRVLFYLIGIIVIALGLETFTIRNLTSTSIRLDRTYYNQLCEHYHCNDIYS